MKEMTPAALQQTLSAAARPPLLLDVREPFEFEICHIIGAVNIPMREVPSRVSELDADQELVVICHHGGRSMRVAMFLEQQGFTNVFNLSGGVDAWACSVDPDMPRY
ncbi:MAG: sulfurtransferase [Gammaproteobacteria bacterium]|nr:sulfurtransferase [Gammaproteobacteria bacterium]